MGIITLVLLITLETAFLTWSIITRNSHREEKGIANIALLVLFGLLLITGIFEWSFRYVPLSIVLVIQAIASVVILVRKKEVEYRLRKNVLRFISNGFIFTFALSISILFPQYEQLKTTGGYEVVTTKYTWTDTGRLEEFSQLGENRALTVEFWYPKNADKKYPLVVFSHGAFGFSRSNYSTFAQLASNGYVVASIGHTYHAFYTLDTSGKLITADAGFINKASEINTVHDTQHEEEIYHITSGWMKLCTSDENFVIDTILEQSINSNADAIFSMIDTEKIGLMGHSLGGASSAQIGRERDDIDAVIVLDGTMLGEEVAFENNAVVLNNKPYPIPLLNVYAEDHYTNSKESVGDAYNNFYATRNAVNAYETVFKNSGHLNFTDLPLFSPTLAQILGIGTIDERYCIETTNRVVLEFFGSYLKDKGLPKIEKEY